MSYDFDGSNDRIDCTSSNLPSGYPLSYGGWFHANSAESDTNDIFMSIADKDNGTNQHRIVHTGAPLKWVASSFDGSGGAKNSGGHTEPFSTGGSWHHFLAVHASATSRILYLDGVADTEDTTSCSPTGLDRLTIGTTADSTPFGYLNGRAAQCGVWNIALTEDDAVSLAAGVLPPRVRGDALSCYLPLSGHSYDLIEGVSASVSGAVVYDEHPPITYGNNILVSLAGGVVAPSSLSFLPLLGVG